MVIALSLSKPLSKKFEVGSASVFGTLSLQMDEEDDEDHLQHRDVPRPGGPARDIQAQWDALLEPQEEAGQEIPEAEADAGLQRFHDLLGQPRVSRKGRPNRALQEFFSEMAGAEVVPGAGALAEPEREMAPDVPERAPVLKVLPSIPQVLSNKFLRRAMAGSAVKHPATAVLQEAWRQVILEKVPSDEKVGALASKYLHSGFHLTSTVVLQQQFDVDPRGAMTRLNRLACSLWLQDLWERASLEQTLVQHLPAQSLLFYGDFCSYDETPMVTAVKLSKGEATSSNPLQDPLPHHVACLEALHRGVPCPKLSTTSKLLQVRQEYGMLLKIQLGNRPQDPFFCYILGNTSSPLQAMGRNNAQTLVECLRRVQGNDPSANGFQSKARVVVLDQAPANSLAEDVIMHSRPAGWQHVILPCDTHKVSLCMSKTFDQLLAPHVSGLINTAISIREGGKMSIFRAALSEVIQERLRICRGECSMEAKKHREAVMDLFITHDNNGIVKRTMLTAAANGDWRNPEQLEHYVPRTDPAPTAQQVGRHVEKCLVAALAGHQPHMYPRHRWTGADEAVDDLAILFAVHNLLPHVYARFQNMVDNKAQGLDTRRLNNPESEERSDSANPNPGFECSDAPVIAEDGLLHSGMAAPLLPTAGPVPESLSAAQNAHVRSSAGKWMYSEPYAHLCLMRVVLNPLCQLMRDQLFLGGQDYELQERCKMAQAMSEGTTGGFDGRSFRVVEAASGSLEEKFAEQMKKLFTDKSTWAIFPQSCYTVKFRSLCFRLLTRASACVYQLLALSHKIFPIKLFRLIKQRHLSAEYAAIPQCVKDPWTQELQKLFPTFSEADLIHMLVCQAWSMRTDISDIESRHASVRRQLTTRSVQTWKLGFAQAGCEWLLQTFRRRMEPHKKKPSGQVCEWVLWRLYSTLDL